MDSLLTFLTAPTVNKLKNKPLVHKMTSLDPVPYTFVTIFFGRTRPPMSVYKIVNFTHNIWNLRIDYAEVYYWNTSQQLYNRPIW